MNSNQVLRLSAIVLALALIFVGCSGTQQSLLPQDTPTPSATQDVAQTSETPSATPTRTPAITPKVTPSTVPTPEETEEPKVIYDTNPKIIVRSNGVQVLKCKYFKFTITFPKSWKGKYLVAEFEDRLCVYFKPADLTPITYDGKIEYPIFFTIDKVTPEYVTDPDGIANHHFWFKIRGAEYVMYSPTDLQYPPSGPEYDTYLHMNLEASFKSDSDNIGIE